MRRWLLPALALLAFAATLIAPQTGWLARRQVRIAWLGQGEAELKRLKEPPKIVPATPAIEAVWKLDRLCRERLRLERADLFRLVSPTTRRADGRLSDAVRNEALARGLRFTQSVEVSRRSRIVALLAFLVLGPLLIGLCLEPLEASSRDFTWLPWSERPRLVWLAAVCSPVVLLQLGGGIRALVKRRPIGQGILGGVSKGAIPMAGLILILWCAGTIWLAREEARQVARFERAMQINR